MNHASWIAAALGLVMWLPATIASAAERAEENSSEFVEALVPVEVLPPDPATANGEVRGFGLRWNAIVIAAQPARVLRAVIAGEPGAFIGKKTVLNFTVLGPIKSDATGRLAIDDDRTRSAWCEDDSRQHATIHCFQDLDGDGKLDTVRSGVLPKLDALSVNRVGSPQPVAPFSYREAGTEELPGALLQYISCPADEPTYKYALAIRRTDGRSSSSSIGDCNAVATAIDSDGSTSKLYAFGRFKVALSGEGSRKTATLVEGIPAGTLLGHVRADRPLTDATAAKSFREDLADLSGGLPFLYFVAAPQVTKGTAASGSEILVGEVAHAITGKLSAPLVSVGYLGRKEELPAGTPVYGALMSNTRADANLDPAIVWCTPDQGGKKSWYSRCMARGAVGLKLVLNVDRFTLGTLSVGSGGKSILDPLVERQPVDFGEPIHVMIRFDKWDKRYAMLSIKTGFRSDDAPFRDLRLRRSSDGSAYLVTGGSLIKLHPADTNPADVQVEHEGDIEAGSDAQPIDAFTLQKELKKN